jgi:hypothetical protein
MKFLVTHPLPPGATRSDIEKLAASVQKDPEIRGYRSFLNLTEGRGACILEAPSKTRLAEWLRKNNMTFDLITEVELEGYRGEWVEVETPVSTGV